MSDDEIKTQNVTIRSRNRNKPGSVDDLLNFESIKLEIPSPSDYRSPSYQLNRTPIKSKAILNRSNRSEENLYTSEESRNDTELDNTWKPDASWQTETSDSEVESEVETEIHDSRIKTREFTRREKIIRLNPYEFRRRKNRSPKKSTVAKAFEHLFIKNPKVKKENMGDKLTYTDLMNAIPVFEGHQKDLDYFISTCSTYNDQIEDTQKDMFVSIIKTRLKGIALTKMEPVHELNTWALIKTRLEEKFKRPMNYEAAQDEISNIRQSRTDSIETYGNNVRLALHKLNKAAETLSTENGALKLLRGANEKLAIRKFEQGLYNSNLKICVGARDHTTLDLAITYAMQKEGLYRNESRTRCNFCNILGHTEKECRRKQQNSPNQTNYNVNRFRQPNSPNKNESNQRNTNNNYRYRNNSNRWDGNRDNMGRNNGNPNRNFNSTGNSNNSFSNSNSPNNKNSTENAKKFNHRTVTLEEAIKKETKN